MQEIEIDWEKVFIGNDVFYFNDNEGGGLVENPITKKTAFLRVCDDPVVREEIEAFICETVPSVRTSQYFKSIVYPNIYRKKKSWDEEDTYYIFTEIPEHWQKGHFHRLSKAVSVKEFSIHTRIIAALNLSETLNLIHDYWEKNIFFVHPEEIYVNTENGEIFIWIEKWLRKLPEVADEFGFPPEWYSKEERDFDERGFRFFAACVLFRILCGEDPMDGGETLLEFPLLTREAMRDIHSGRYPFVLAEENRSASEYINRDLWRKWQTFPEFVRNEFEKNFTSGIDCPDERTEISKWVKIMRDMRDCLLIVNGQFRFCNPERPDQMLFMEIDDYRIPVWPKKAVYWYHVGIPMSKSQNGIAAGVTLDENGYYLQNLSGNDWDITLDDTTEQIRPKAGIKIMEGMTIRLENGKKIKVIGGLSDNPEKTVGRKV